MESPPALPQGTIWSRQSALQIHVSLFPINQSIIKHLCTPSVPHRLPQPSHTLAEHGTLQESRWATEHQELNSSSQKLFCGMKNLGVFREVQSHSRVPLSLYVIFLASPEYTKLYLGEYYVNTFKCLYFPQSKSELLCYLVGLTDVLDIDS